MQACGRLHNISIIGRYIVKMAIACLPLAGRYEIVRPLNSGGMGAVYEARDLRLNDSPCAIKQLLHSRGKGEYLNAKFEAEMAVLAGLDHPGIPKIRDFFTENGRRYLVMDLIPGPNLHQVLETGGPLEARSLVREMLQALEILGYLHERGLLHRDVKPANLIRDSRNGRLKLVDFGLARSFEVGETFMTQTLVGTSGYAPPEQLAGRAEPASDLYALGATMLHLLTGVSPLFAYPTLDKALDPALLAVLRKAVAMHPRERYPDAASMAAALQGWLETPGTPSRRLWLAGASATLTAAALLGMVFTRPAPAPQVMMGSQPAVLVAQAAPVTEVAPPVLPPVVEPLAAPPAAEAAPLGPPPEPQASVVDVVNQLPGAVQEVAARVRRASTLICRLPLPAYPLAARRAPKAEIAAEPQTPQGPVLGSELVAATAPAAPVLSNGGPLFLRQHGVRLHIPFGYQAREENGEIVATPGPTMPSTPAREVRARVYKSADSAVALVANFKARARAAGDVLAEEELSDGYRVTLSNGGNTIFYRILVRERGKVRQVCETTGRVESQARDLVSQLQPFFGRTTLDGRAPLLAAAPVTALSYQRNSLESYILGNSAGASTPAQTQTAPASTTPVTVPAATAPTAPVGTAPTAPPTGAATAPTSAASTTTPAPAPAPNVPLGLAPIQNIGGGGSLFSAPVPAPAAPPTAANSGPTTYGGPPVSR